MSLVSLYDDILFSNISENLPQKDLLTLCSLSKECYQRGSDYLAKNNPQIVSCYVQKCLQTSGNAGTSILARFPAPVYHTPYDLSVDFSNINQNMIKIVSKKFPKCQKLQVIRPTKRPAKTCLHRVASKVLDNASAFGEKCASLLVYSMLRRAGSKTQEQIALALYNQIRKIRLHRKTLKAKLLRDPLLEKMAFLFSDIQKLHIHVSSEPGMGHKLASLPSLPALKELEVSYEELVTPTLLFSDSHCLHKYTTLKSLTLNNIFFSSYCLGEIPSQLEELTLSGSIVGSELSSLLSACPNLHYLKVADILVDLANPITPYTSLKTLEITDSFIWSKNPFAPFPELNTLKITTTLLHTEDFEPSSSLQHLVLCFNRTFMIGRIESFFRDFSVKYPNLEEISIIFKEELEVVLPPVPGYTIVEEGIVNDKDKRYVLMPEERSALRKS